MVRVLKENQPFSEEVAANEGSDCGLKNHDNEQPDDVNHHEFIEQENEDLEG